MASITLITGGCRSGKSDFAREYAESLEGEHHFIATCPIYDKDMKSRIEDHQKNRDEKIWQTTEELTNLKKVLTSFNNNEVILVDCITLWISNLTYKKHNLHEYDIEPVITELLVALDTLDLELIFVTNEVGMGLVPSDVLSRQYRDMVGKVNQLIAKVSDHVYFVRCGIPIMIKGVTN